MTKTERNINRQSEVKQAQNDQNTTEHCQFDTKGDNCPFDTKGDNCPSDNKGDNCPSDTKGDNCPSYSKGDNCLSVSGPAFDKVNDLNSPPSVNKHTKSDEMAFRIGKMNKDHSEKTIPKEVDCTSGNVDYVFNGSKNLHDLSNQTDDVAINMSNQTDDVANDLSNQTGDVANDLSNQTDDVANGLSNQTDDSADQTYVKLELDDAQTFVDKEEIPDKKLEEILENILYMENIKDKMKNTFTLAFNPDFLLEPNITEEEGDSEDDLYEVQSIEDNEIIKKVLELRGYQEELARPGKDGINTIVIAPTGSGKTHVAMGIIQNHFEVMKDRMVPKAVLIVNNSTLASQHFHELQTYFDFSIKRITGASQDKVNSLSIFVNRHDILIVTAQIWLNSLMEKDTTISAFTLVIFDECHHCAQKHPYNKIMEFYMDAKLKDNAQDIKLPQIIGLTASVNIGKSKEKEVAKEKIVQLMSNLDVHVVSTVRSLKGEQELKEHVQLACDDTRTVPERENNLFGKLIEAQMEILENGIKFSDYDKCIENQKSKEKIKKIPAQRGGDQYTQWIGEIFRHINIIGNEDAHHFYITSRKYLDILNRALILYRDARTSDAYGYICRSIKKKPKPKQHKLDSKMMEWINAMQPQFKAFLTYQNQENPKLVELESIVCDVYRRNHDMRAIVFVKTKDLGTAIVDWMKDSDGLKQLNPETFFGVQASFEKGGLTKNEQSGVLTQFRDGKIKLIVATTIAEEGLDIAKCNLVVRYENITNVIGMVQARGRARAVNSSYLTLGGQKIAERHEINIIAEMLMKKAINELQEEIHNGRTEFEHRLLSLQKASKFRRDALYECDPEANGRYKLQCGDCSQFLSLSVNIKKISGNHHAVVCPDILEYVEISHNPLPGYSDRNICCGRGQLLCKKCDKNVGNITSYHSIPFPILTVKSLRFEDMEGKHKIVPKKWIDAPFKIDNLDPGDLNKLMHAYKKLYKK